MSDKEEKMDKTPLRYRVVSRPAGYRGAGDDQSQITAWSNSKLPTLVKKKNSNHKTQILKGHFQSAVHPVFLSLFFELHSSLRFPNCSRLYKCKYICCQKNKKAKFRHHCWTQANMPQLNPKNLGTHDQTSRLPATRGRASSLLFGG